MIDIHKITISRSQLDAIPDDERKLLALIAHAANELNIFAKLFHFSAGGCSDNPILKNAEKAQTFALGRVLTGKIYECWNLLQVAFFQRPALSQTYLSRFDPESKKALKDVKQYFGKSNLISKVRNKHAFHYSLDQIDAGYHALGEGDSLDLYLSEYCANRLYVFGESIAGRAMLETIMVGDAEGALRRLIDDTSKMVSLINIVIGEIIEICINTHLGGTLYSLGAQVIEIEAPSSQDVSIPYFIEIERTEE
ncbi:hypothetical protein WAE56_14400 [Iodobacter sp. LRB]|uniref:hypothetical protein n=1 Tax=unclassified Iodobacter TaxID=235634 RepID=UPI000C118452|nr:hypothetical protein [Iodobacter sp. BJB302]PHV00673.1 hypothetical protein CSQ88_15935 [Iodobacter sp. BJB302]